MSKWILAAGAAALAIATPALAGPGGGHGGEQRGGAPGGKGGGEQHGGGQAMGAARGGGGGHGGGDHGGGQAMFAPQQHGGGHAQAQEHRGGGMRMVRAQREHGGGRVREAHGNDNHGNQAKAFREQRVDRVAIRDDGRLQGRVEQRDLARIVTRDEGNRIARFDNGDSFRGYRGLIDGCPPGLAKKNNGCLPPGQANKLLGGAIPASLGLRSLSGPYSQWYRDNDQYYYRNDGSYIYQVSRNGGLIDALIPYSNYDYGYYPVGMTYPSDYNSYNVPYQYRSFYPDGGDYNYRYGNNAIYQVDPRTNGIQSIVALLAGDLAVGQRLPPNYGVYNVPLDYRDRYYDTPDALYRYNDGYIYQADPTTQLITAVIQAIV